MVYYAVAKGKSTGVYSDWQSCKNQVNGYSGASYQKFNTAAEASQFVNSGGHSNSNSSYTPSSSSYYSGSYSSTSSYPSSSSRSSGGSTAKSHASTSSTSTTRTSSNTSSYSDDDSSSYSASYGGSSHAKPKQATQANQPKQQIYVDGASRGNGKHAMPDSGYGVWYGDNHPKNAAVPLTKVDNVKINKPTNQRAELFGMAHALKDVRQDLSSGSNKNYEILTDSAYAKNSIEKWSESWEKNGWKNSQGKPVANRDIIETARKDYRAIKSYANKNSGSVEITHVRGHQGDIGNENADRLANEGADAMAIRKP